ncbi:MAG: hypothetical protein IJU76_15535 [Desulfovibrionaceae bacterium]|nr:hypothetical protein [Desulfovibrionaceae bacterium]
MGATTEINPKDTVGLRPLRRHPLDTIDRRHTRDTTDRRRPQDTIDRRHPRDITDRRRPLDIIDRRRQTTKAELILGDIPIGHLEHSDRRTAGIATIGELSQSYAVSRITALSTRKHIVLLKLGKRNQYAQQEESASSDCNSRNGKSVL